MEYLEIKGAVHMKPTNYPCARQFILGELQAIHFDEGFIAVHIEENILSIVGEGVTSSMFRLRALLEDLKTYLTNQSTIEISSIRWETTVVLYDGKFPLASHFEPSRQVMIR